MTLNELLSQIRDLGFSDDDEMAEFGELVYNSINRAMSIIAHDVAPVIGELEIEQDGTDEGYNYYDIRRLTRKNGVETFLQFADTPVMIENEKGTAYQKFNDFDIEQDSILVFAPDISGTFKVFYKKDPEKYSQTSDLNTVLDLPLKVHHLVPLLASYYVWLEDEQVKATQYYNMYEQEAQAIIAEEANKKFRVRVLPGGM